MAHREATADHRIERQVVGIPTAGHRWQLLGLLLLQQPDTPSCYPADPSREASFPLFAFFCRTCLILLITYKNKEKIKKPRDYIIKRTKN